MRTLVVIAAVGIVAALLVVVAILAVQRKMLFPRPSPPPHDVTTETAGVEKLRVGKTESVEAWLLEPLEKTERHPAIIFGHGNGELIDHWVAEFEPVRAWGFAVLLVEYPGYGRSSGSPSQAAITETFVAAYDYLASRSDIRRDAIVGYGRSLGGAAVCQLAARRDVAALILESTFTSVADMAGTLGVPRWLVRDPFDNIAVLRTYRNPVLLLHGRSDGIVPFSHAEALHSAARASVLEPMDCGHNDCERPWRQIDDFLGQRIHAE
ncbi:MAG: alpha/beta hydrolase [bacterium]|nr:alpha/beta hydrolase [bacterium]